MVTDLLDELKQIPELKSLPEEQLKWLVEKGTVAAYRDGDRAFKKGEPIESMRIVLKGEISYWIEQNGNLRNAGTMEKGEITGRLPFSRMKNSTGEGIVNGDTLVYSLHKDFFPELVRSYYELAEVLVHAMTDRVRDFTKQQQLNDKMMALGKLSAGLSHELNNPSAAVVRSAHELKRLLSNVPENFKRVIKIRATDDAVDRMNELVSGKIKAYGQKHLSLIQKTALEDDLNEWLDENAIDNGFEMVETFVEYGIQPDDLDLVKNDLRKEDLLPVVGWLHQVLSTEKLVDEIEESSNRINTLVCSVKGYTHMDQAPEKQRTDIHPGIRNTLTMLNHKLKKNNITLVENFQADLPEANIYASEMNQVWTNLIDNAIDAMEGRPNSKLEIKTEKQREFIHVSIIDNGPGIPKDIQDKIYDPFFTTKSIGKGTGLGLEVVRQIISQHNGKVDLYSEPGRTAFVVCFPI